MTYRETFTQPDKKLVLIAESYLKSEICGIKSIKKSGIPVTGTVLRPTLATLNMLNNMAFSGCEIWIERK